MGERLRQLYEEAGKVGGLRAKVRLAVLTGVSSTQAALAPDGAAVLAQFGTALQTLRREFGASRATEAAAAAPQPAGNDASAPDLRRRLNLFVDLVSQRALYLGDQAKTLARVTEVSAAALDVARVSVWLLEEAGPAVKAIRCVDLFERATGLHSSGSVLRADSFPPYFRALETERTIAAHEAHQDPRTRCFSEPYLTPLGINSMLDVPVWVGGQMTGVVCHEHVGPARTWSRDDEDFAYLVSGFLAMLLEPASRAR